LYLLWVIIFRGGKKVYEPPRFMTVNTAISQLLEVEEARGESGIVSELHFFQKCSSPNIN
jgi:diphthamide biosynthesis methyltransferase